MKRYTLIALSSLLLCFTGPVAVAHAEQTVFGPMKYSVKDRHGKLNRYTATFPARDADYVIKLQNGEKIGEKVDWLELTVNGEKVIQNDKYAYPFIACFVRLRSENTMELVMRDDFPSGLRRPAAYPKNVLLTVLEAPAKTSIPNVSMGLAAWSRLGEVSALVQLAKPAAAPAMEAISVRNDAARRAEALRTLAQMKDRTATAYLSWVYGDLAAPPVVRGEAALGLGLLGDPKHIPLLMVGIIDPDQAVAVASSRALALYPEQDTQEHLVSTLQKLDTLRKDAAIQTIVKAGWKPVNTMIILADSSDPHVVETALAVLGGMQHPRATEFLLKTLQEPGKKDVQQVIRALGQTKDQRAVDALIAMAADATLRKGREMDLGDALAALGDQRAEGALRDLIKTAPSPYVAGQLRAAYRKLMGRDY